MPLWYKPHWYFDIFDIHLFWEVNNKKPAKRLRQSVWRVISQNNFCEGVQVPKHNNQSIGENKKTIQSKKIQDDDIENISRKIIL